MSPIRREQPIVIAEGRALELAKRMARWITNLSPDDSGHGNYVVGLYGPRGAGKTSLLRTLLNELREHTTKNELREHTTHGADSPSAPRLVLPTPEVNEQSWFRALFKPADLRDGDDLLFQLLRHLKENSPKTPSSSTHNQSDELFFKAREIEVRRRDFDRFVRYQEEVAASQNALQEELVPGIVSSFRVIGNGREHPGEAVADHDDKFAEQGSERGSFPTPIASSHIKAPEVNGVAANAKVPDGIVGWTGFDDDSSASFAGANV